MLTGIFPYDTGICMELDVDKITRLRQAQGMTLKDVADRMGLKTRQHVKVLLDYKNPRNAERFAKVFGVDPMYLLQSSDSDIE